MVRGKTMRRNRNGHNNERSRNNNLSLTAISEAEDTTIFIVYLLHI